MVEHFVKSMAKLVVVKIYFFNNFNSLILGWFNGDQIEFYIRGSYKGSTSYPQSK